MNEKENNCSCCGKEVETSVTHTHNYKTCKKCRDKSTQHYYNKLKNNPEQVRKERKQSWHKHKEHNPARVFHNQLRNRARARNLPFDLIVNDVKELIKVTDCKCCGNANDFDFQFDRLIPERGYTKANTRYICETCNRHKADNTIETLKQVNAYIIRELNLNDQEQSINESIIRMNQETIAIQQETIKNLLNTVSMLMNNNQSNVEQIVPTMG